MTSPRERRGGGQSSFLSSPSKKKRRRSERRSSPPRCPCRGSPRAPHSPLPSPTPPPDPDPSLPLKGEEKTRALLSPPPPKKNDEGLSSPSFSFFLPYILLLPATPPIPSTWMSVHIVVSFLIGCLFLLRRWPVFR